ncbi:TolC family protein [Oxalobacteraceae bacterium A2-2]
MNRSKRLARAAAAAAVAAALAGCATSSTPPAVAAPLPQQWQAPLPHGGSQAGMADWWRHHADPLLAQLIASAQEASPSVASAAARIAQARAERVASGAALAPTVDAVASTSRASQQSTTPMGTTSTASLQAAWEIDVFGANRAARDAAQQRLDSAQAGWHEARVSVAAEVANQYYALRACRQLLSVAQQDAESRRGTARLTELSARAGFQPPATAAQARASAADGASRAIAQRATCDNSVKSLVALAAVPEPELRQRLDASDVSALAAPSSATPGYVPPAEPQEPGVWSGRIPGPVAVIRHAGAYGAPAMAIATLPAAVLRQRPDVYRAEREVAAASAEVDGARAQRYPRLSLTGSVGKGSFRSDGQSITASTWTLGPLTLSLPLFDAGRRQAYVDAAIARYESAVAAYRGAARTAVSEVEQALVNLDATSERATHAETALEGYRSAYRATEDLYRNGMASLLELEDARRTRLAAENTVINLRQERNAAWVALYRAAGGGWSAPDHTNLASSQ